MYVSAAVVNVMPVVRRMSGYRCIVRSGGAVHLIVAKFGFKIAVKHPGYVVEVTSRHGVSWSKRCVNSLRSRIRSLE